MRGRHDGEELSVFAVAEVVSVAGRMAQAFFSPDTLGFNADKLIQRYHTVQRSGTF